MGMNMNLFDIEGWIARDFSVSYIFVNKRDGFKGSITIVYGGS
jgi:hypothetical protein